MKAEELISKITVDSLPASYYFPIVLFDWLKALTNQSRPPARTSDSPLAPTATATHSRLGRWTDGVIDAAFSVCR